MAGVRFPADPYGRILGFLDRFTGFLIGLFFILKMEVTCYSEESTDF
jgi:preprotein translocase subunit SecG